MSIAKNYETHKNDIEIIMAYIRDLTLLSETGRQLEYAYAQLIVSGKIVTLYTTIQESNFGNEVIEDLINSLNRYMYTDPSNSMNLFAKLIKNVSAKIPKEDGFDRTLLAIHNTATDLANSKEYQDFIIASQNFKNDSSKEAGYAKEAIEAMNRKFTEWLSK